MSHVLFAVLAAGLAGTTLESPSVLRGTDWIEPMRRVHSRFQGQAGTLALFGDSISVSLAFWAPLAYECRNVPPEMEHALRVVKAYLRPECWREWRGPEFGNEGSTTVRWAKQHIDDWLKRLNPETAIIMFGTNDINDMDEKEYRTTLSQVVRKCLDHGTVVILTTIPPRHGREEKSAAFAQAIREVAAEHHVPVIDYYAEIMKRRPADWDGASESFAGYEVYEVPTLISRDGVHPSNPQKFMGDFSEEALRCSGYGLRNYLSVLAYAEVIEKVLRGDESKREVPPLEK